MQPLNISGLHLCPVGGVCAHTYVWPYVSIRKGGYVRATCRPSALSSTPRLAPLSPPAHLWAPTVERCDQREPTFLNARLARRQHRRQTSESRQHPLLLVYLKGSLAPNTLAFPGATRQRAAWFQCFLLGLSGRQPCRLGRIKTNYTCQLQSISSLPSTCWPAGRAHGGLPRNVFRGARYPLTPRSRVRGAGSCPARPSCPRRGSRHALCAWLRRDCPPRPESRTEGFRARSGPRGPRGRPIPAGSPARHPSSPLPLAFLLVARQRGAEALGFRSYSRQSLSCFICEMGIQEA